jgi:glycosyltransferase involved in cell wall biosynthesis
MKITVVETFGSGGLIHFSYQLCRALADKGCDVKLITSDDYELASYPHNFSVDAFMHLWPSQDPASMRLAPDSLMHALWHKLHWKARRLVRAAKFIWQWNRLTHSLLKERPDIIQFSLIHYPFQAYFLNRLQRSGILLTQVCHEYEQRDTRPGLIRRLNLILSQKIYRSFSAIFFLAEQTRQDFHRFSDISSDHTYTIPHGDQSMFLAAHEQRPDMRLQYEITADERVILFFGVIRPSKGLPDLLEAFALLPRDMNARLLIVGYPTKHADMGELQNIIHKHQLAHSVIIDPRYIDMKEVGPLMEAATVVVFPYRNATQSGALHLAYSFGRPVIATTVGGLAEDVKDGQTGYLVPPESPVDLAAAMVRLLEDPERLARMGNEARRLSQTEHSWDAVAERILGVYEKLLLEPVMAQVHASTRDKSEDPTS